MYDIPKGSTSHPLLFFMVDSTDHVTGKTGLTPTVTIRKVGGSFAAPSGAVTEVASGWYQVAGNATDSNTAGPLALHATGTAADPTDAVYNVIDKTVAIYGANVEEVGADARGAYIVKGTAVAIANGSITLASGQGTTLADVESLVIVLTGGTNAIGKSRYISHDAGDVFTVDPAWNAGETLPSGTITYQVLPAPPSPTSLIPAVNLTEINGVAVDTAQAQIGVSVVNVTTAAAQDLLTEIMVEDYAADGSAPTLAQAIFAIQQFLQEKAISGTTLTVKKLDGTTTAMTFTLSSATTPTSVTRAT